MMTRDQVTAVVALLHALPDVTFDDAWAAAERMAARGFVVVRAKTAEAPKPGDKPDHAERLLAIVRGAGEITATDLLKRTRFMTKDARDEAVRGFVASGQIALHNFSTTGRPVCVYRAVSA